MRIGYVCKYVPAEALEAMGAHMERIEPDESLVSFDAAESCMHANVCSFAKATFETVLSGNLDGIVLTTCCDSMRRLADTLRAQAPNLFIHVLDVPRDTGEAACALYQRRVAELLSAYGKFANATFSEKKLFAQLGGTLCPEEGNCDSSLELDFARLHSEAAQPSFISWLARISRWIPERTFLCPAPLSGRSSLGLRTILRTPVTPPLF